jgi:tripartite-type tricarboxylate transporter receptor subunit TctC
MYPAVHDALLELQPVSRISATPLMIVGKNALPLQHARELIAWLKENPGKASAATVGAGSAAHICLLYFQQKTGTRFQLVPYRGGAPVMQDLVAGQIDFFCAEASQTLSFLRSGAIRPFAVMSKERWPAASDVPTMDEVGARDVHFLWHGLWGPKSTPRDVATGSTARSRIRSPTGGPAAAHRAGKSRHAREQTPEALAAFHKAEIEQWWPIIKAGTSSRSDSSQYTTRASMTRDFPRPAAENDDSAARGGGRNGGDPARGGKQQCGAERNR